MVRIYLGKEDESESGSAILHPRLSYRSILVHYGKFYDLLEALPSGRDGNANIATIGHIQSIPIKHGRMDTAGREGLANPEQSVREILSDFKGRNRLP